MRSRVSSGLCFWAWVFLGGLGWPERLVSRVQGEIDASIVQREYNLGRWVVRHGCLGCERDVTVWRGFDYYIFKLLQNLIMENGAIPRSTWTSGIWSQLKQPCLSDSLEPVEAANVESILNNVLD